MYCIPMYLDQTSKAVKVNVSRHNSFVQLISHMFFMAVPCIDPEDSLCLKTQQNPESGHPFVTNKKLSGVQWNKVKEMAWR